MLHILAVDDDEVTQFHLTQLLMPLGKVRIASSGLDALECVRTALDKGKPYDLILMDVKMPGLDGLTTVREIVGLFNKLRLPLEERPKIIMLSAVDEPDTRIDALYACGADAYLIKPLEGESLLAALRELKVAQPDSPAES
ncbi:response regulator [Fundidesulfovibrio agrisoli]|uniref:response regulator n=1 Tax=Fundidesulfovibrio agrisoli TaxID=2922717 RepID=UPI001FAC5576|nr:response regulator [Fundidesulfovibrio agrisoli]